jgi:hypothetical protein
MFSAERELPNPGASVTSGPGGKAEVEKLKVASRLASDIGFLKLVVYNN